MNFSLNLSDPLCLNNLKACCAASQLAYTQPTITDADSGESVLIQNCGNCTLIAFPGTHDLRDVLRDINCLRLATVILGQPCAVHAGFNRAHNALIERILGVASARPVTKNCPQLDFSPSPPPRKTVGLMALARCTTDEKRTTGGNSIFGDLVGQLEIPSRKTWGQGSALFLTGHSKGAAVARRCALALLEKNFPVAGLITFGEPRGGDARYAAICNRALANHTLRITNAADPVPWMPAWLAGNRHAGPEAWLPANTQYGTRNTKLILGPRLWLQLLLNSAEIFRAWQLKDLAPLADHHIDIYLRRLNAL